MLTGVSLAQAQPASKPTPNVSPVATAAPKLPSSVVLDFPLPGEPGMDMGSFLVHRPGIVGAAFDQVRAPGGPYWEELVLIKDNQPAFEFGFLLGAFHDNVLRLQDCLKSIEAVPEKCTETLYTFRVNFKPPPVKDALDENPRPVGLGGSPVAYTDYDGRLPLAMGLNAVEVSLRRGPVSIAYDPYELSLISERSGAHELTLFYVAAMRFAKSRRYLINPDRLFQIMSTYKVVPDVNEPTSFGTTGQRRFTAIANLVNSEMATWDECLYDALEPETDTVSGLQISGAKMEEPSIPKPGEKPKPPKFQRIEPQRIFRKVRLPAHELAMVKRLEAMQTSGVSTEKIREYRSLVNRVLLDRLMVDHWEKTTYLLNSLIVGRGMKLLGMPSVDRQVQVMGTEIAPYVPAPTEILRIAINIPKDSAKTTVKPNGTPQSKPGFVIPDDFNPLTHEVLYDKDGNPVAVRPRQP
jgi:hypothetical protein